MIVLVVAIAVRAVRVGDETIGIADFWAIVDPVVIILVAIVKQHIIRELDRLVVAFLVAQFPEFDGVCRPEPRSIIDSNTIQPACAQGIVEWDKTLREKINRGTQPFPDEQVHQVSNICPVGKLGT